MNILGISFSMHESAACLVQDGKLVFACAEERLSKLKQDASFPALAIQAALDFAGITAADVDHVAIAWDRPGRAEWHTMKLLLTGQFPLSRMRLERTVMSLVQGRRHRGGLRKYTHRFSSPNAKLHFVNHHLAHAYSALAPSGYRDAAILVIDGRGASEATTLWHAKDGHVSKVGEYRYPDSLGVFYAGITAMLGFKPLSDEWKVMGLAAYGRPTYNLGELIKVNENDCKVEGWKFFGRSDDDLGKLEQVLGPRRDPNAITQDNKDLASSAQAACEQAMLALLRRVTEQTGERKLCLAGGVALNCKANGELLRSGLIDEIYVQPAAGDDGACIGAAYRIHEQVTGSLPYVRDENSYLGTEHGDDEVESVLKTYKLSYYRKNDPSQEAARLLADGNLIGWFQGRMEFGPRALGNRSILSDPRFAENRDKVNAAVKFRENWRPFAPSVLEEKAPIYFQDFRHSPHMILSFWATEEGKRLIPAVVHVDGSCRVQSVTRESNLRYYELIKQFGEMTGVYAVMNTSFNLKGDAIVESPKDAIQTFFTSGLDHLVIGSFIVSKKS
ncbi:MAG TPA: carbamoyltransferase [Planctomycetaceae bacterium]|nr:carbamoyltransferase [Planctomycetaceae bacterium]